MVMFQPSQDLGGGILNLWRQVGAKEKRDNFISPSELFVLAALESPRGYALTDL